MNYKRHYENLITRAKGRIYNKDDYTERHHIVPRCMGGSDDRSNLVNLYAREHFVAHQLLVKIYPAINGLVYALVKMLSEKDYHKGRINNRLYRWIKQRNNILQSKPKKDKPWSEKRRLAYLENPPKQSESANIARRKKLLGLKNSTGMEGHNHTRESKDKISKSQLNKMKDSPRTIYAWLKSPNGDEIHFGPLSHECKKYNLILEYVSDLCKGHKNLYKGWTFLRLSTDIEKKDKIQNLRLQGLMI